VIVDDSQVKEGNRKMIILDGAVMLGLAALITNVAALVWSVRRKA
jgi:hypothetical protein